MEQDNLYGIFHILSRIIIVIAIITLVLGLIIRFNQNRPKIQPLITNQKPSIAIPVKQSNSVKISTAAAQLNLKGPFVCRFSSPEATVSASVKDNNAYAQIKKPSITNNILLKGDCIYYWKNASTQGEKLCGLSPYISIFGNIPLANLLENNQLLSLFGNLGKNQSIFPIDIKKIPSILNSCKKDEVKNEEVFRVPTNRVFQDKMMF